MTIESLATVVGASQTSGSPINHIIRKKQIRTKIKKMESLMSTNMRKIMKYSVTIQDISCEFGLALKRKKNHLEKEVLLRLPNPKFQELQKTYVHLIDL